MQLSDFLTVRQRVEHLARSDPRVAASATEWDIDPWLLNTPAGVVDLRTGEVLASDLRLPVTRITRASPGNGCPLWLAFIPQITGADAELAGYLQRVAGYCLTGRTDERVFFFLHGPGANGAAPRRCGRCAGALAHPAGLSGSAG